jgi:hypothetical protein
MFVIKSNQIDALSATGRENFIHKMMKLLRKDYEDIRKMPLQELHDDILAQITKANKYGFHLNSSLATYIVSSFAMGENFDNDFQGAKEILLADLHEIERSKNLENWVNVIFTTLENS